jgi:hypothetical protein
MFITQKPASHRYNVEKRMSGSIAHFMMMGYSCQRDDQNEAISVDECFSFSLLLFPIFVSSSSATINSADSNALLTNESLTQSKEDASSDRKYFSMFLLSSDKLYRIKSAKFLSSPFIICVIILYV